MAGGQREDQLQLQLTPQSAFRSLQNWLVRRAYAGDLDHEVAVAPRPSAARRIPTGERSGMLSRRTQFGHNRRAEPRRRGWRLRLEPFSRFPRQEFCRWKRRRLRLSISPECSEVSPSGTQDGHNFHQWDRDRAVTTEQNWWAGTGLNRRHQDFRSIPRNRQERESADPVSGDWIDVVDLEYPRMVLKAAHAGRPHEISNSGSDDLIRGVTL